jgi:CheY-like chemotaxis protein
MPLMTGVEVAREVRRMGCPLYIVGCTGNALVEDQVCQRSLAWAAVRLLMEQEEYIRAGADDIITKPIHQKSVQEHIRHARRRIAGETQPRDWEEAEQ